MSLILDVRGALRGQAGVLQQSLDGQTQRVTVILDSRQKGVHDKVVALLEGKNLLSHVDIRFDDTQNAVSDIGEMLDGLEDATTPSFSAADTAEISTVLTDAEIPVPVHDPEAETSIFRPADEVK